MFMAPGTVPNQLLAAMNHRNSHITIQHMDSVMAQLSFGLGFVYTQENM